MKKKTIILAASAILLLAVLFVPVVSETYAGTKEYTALTYKIVKWNIDNDKYVYRKTRVYPFPNNFSSINTLLEETINNNENLLLNKWVDKSKAEKYDYNIFENIKITNILPDCFFARTLQSNYRIKINGKLPDKWCINDIITCACENIYVDRDNHRTEADFITADESEFQYELIQYAKPVIYLYPEKETDVSVKLDIDGRLTCTYPKYENGWKITAQPDGTLTDSNGKKYNYLYWEADSYGNFDFSKGFCIKGSDTAEFLEKALAELGLNSREANEFIVYWLPLMQNNPYNIISFQSDAYTQAAKLNISPSPDTLIRVFMAYKPSHCYVEINEQELCAPERSGFTAVEWGGSEIK